jgi:hypothetical protein
VIILLDKEKAFEKTEHPFMVKKKNNYHQVRYKRNVTTNRTEAIYEKQTINFTDGSQLAMAQFMKVQFSILQKLHSLSRQYI